MSTSVATASAQNLKGCHTCLKLVAVTEHRCPRCHSSVHLRKKDSIQRTLALLVTACLLYIPANIYPIMYTEQLGSSEGSTIVGGVLELIHAGEAPIAIVIFLFSIIVPSGKIMVMFYLTWTVERRSPLDARQRALLYRVTEFVGKWSMVDVFVVSILVTLVHLGDLLVVRPGVAAVSFAAVVITTMLATESFDARLIWDNMSENNSDK